MALGWLGLWLGLAMSDAGAATASTESPAASRAEAKSTDGDEPTAGPAEVEQEATPSSPSRAPSEDAQAAVRRAQRALEISERKNGFQHPVTGMRLSNLGQLYAAQGEYAKALPLLERALNITERASGPDHADTGKRLNNLGLLHRKMGQYAKALPLFQRALAIAEKGDGPEDATLSARLNNLALLYSDMGRYSMALPLSQRALAIDEKVNGPDHPNTATRLNNLGLLHRRMGRYGMALPLYQRALAIDEKVNGPDHPQTAKRLNNLALLYADLGQPAQALPLVERAVAISERANGPGHPDTGKWLNNLALLHLDMRQPARALPLFERALAISEKASGPGHPDTGTWLGNLALSYQALGQTGKALPLLERALVISEVANGPDHPDTGQRLSQLGQLRQALGEPARAQALYERALAIAEGADAPALAWRVLGQLMRLHARPQAPSATAREPALAIWYGKRSVNDLQTVRTGLRDLDRSLDTSFVKQYEGTYQTLTNLLIEAGRMAEAEQVLAMLKKAELAELTRSADVMNTRADDTRAEERRASAEQQRLMADGVKEAAELVELNRRLANLDPTEAQRRQDLLKRAQARREALQRFYAGLARDFANEGQRGQERQAATETTRLQAKVALDKSVAVGLHYVMTEERLGIIVATPGGSFGRFSAIGRAELNRLIGALRTAITAHADPRAPAQALWRALIEPVQADLLAAGAKTLVISPTDSLRYLPFAALQDPNGRYLVQDYALSLWAAAVDVKPATSNGAWRVAGLGLTQPKPGFVALPAAGAELRSIVRTGDNPRGMLSGSIQLDEQFGRREFEAALTGSANIVHVASHFDFKPGDESRSVLLLGKGNETLSLGELAVLDFSHVDLLTLSACETAVGGGENENGAEVEGLAAVVLKAQGQAVLASLWKVADASTAELMRVFYAQRVAGGAPVSRAQALRQAQLALLLGTPQAGGAAAAEPIAGQRGATAVGRSDKPLLTPMPTDPTRPWAHPYYWAPFVLSGNWL